MGTGIGAGQSMDQGLSALLFSSHDHSLDSSKARTEQTQPHPDVCKPLFTRLPFDVCVALLLHQSPPTIAALAATCRFWHATIGTSAPLLMRHHLVARFRIPLADMPLHQRRLGHDPFESSWTDFYRRLDLGVACWHGLALDPSTNAFQPYLIDVIVRDHRDAPCVSRSPESLGSPGRHGAGQDERHLHGNAVKTSVVSGIVASAVGAEAAGVTTLRRVRLTEMEGFCRFRSLNDALTRIEATLIDASPLPSSGPPSSQPSPAQSRVPRSPPSHVPVPSLHASRHSEAKSPWSVTSSVAAQPLPPPFAFPLRFHLDRLMAPRCHILRPIVFEETQVVRDGFGNLAIPNRYYGFTNGFVMLGLFDPGSPDCLGIFAAVLEDAMPQSWPAAYTIGRGSFPGDDGVVPRSVPGNVTLTEPRSPPWCWRPYGLTIGRSLQGYLHAAVPHRLQTQDRTVYACRLSITSITSTALHGDLHISMTPCVNTCSWATDTADGYPADSSSSSTSWLALRFKGVPCVDANTDGVTGALHPTDTHPAPRVVLDAVDVWVPETKVSSDHAAWMAEHVPTTLFRIYQMGTVWIGLFTDPFVGVLCLF
ncbi:hypothetical protein BC831DRAFT_479361 [Entophlyctis helioformis]|nr:hypothetical protein BC831DRAFT_479361 [Entophlyctis helioformis]